MEWTLWPYMLGLYKHTIVVYNCTYVLHAIPETGMHLTSTME